MYFFVHSLFYIGKMKFKKRVQLEFLFKRKKKKTTEMILFPKFIVVIK